jgi:predicted ABC-type transport system involved in lysophospholipase L1 biosynthesis ATPase subunit
MVSLARRNLLHDRQRFVITVAGVAFAVTLVLVQVGLFMGLLDKATVTIRHASADIWVTSKETPNVDEYALSVKGARHGARDEAARVLEQVGLGDRLHFLPRDLSGGQKQRVAIARALAGSPPANLADEPTANLDTAPGSQVLRMFRDLARREGKGLLIVTHDPKVREVADRLIGIRDGQLVGAAGAGTDADAGRQRREEVAV